MMTVPPGVKIHLALGFTDMRKSFDGLSMTVQEVLKEDPFSGHLFVFRGRKSDMIRILFWDGNGMCLFSKRLEQGYFVWPSVRETGITHDITSAQLSMLIEGIDWRKPERTWRPLLAG
jgi:transposase